MTPHNLLDMVSNVAEMVAQRLPPTLSSSTTSSRNLDVTWITDRILATSKPSEAPIPTRNDTGRNGISTFTPNDNTCTTSATPIHEEQHQLPLHYSTKPRAGVNPGALSSFLTRRHDHHFLLINLSEEEPDDRTLLLLNRQILSCGWSSPCITKSETPCLPHVLDICYTMHAYLSLDTNNILCVYCANGRTRTAIVIACYLKFTNVVTTSLQGFQLFIAKKCPHLDPTATLQHIPPSLTLFFRNFDSCIQLSQVMNPKPLLLRAIAVQGVPVDDKPCIDIWNSQQEHVYASNHDDSLSQWADEEGFYRVNQVLEGDFLLLCRFGGRPHHNVDDDPSKVLFRYANTTGFLASGPYELPKSKVDMMRRYVTSFDPDDFSLTLLFESYWDCTQDEYKEQLQRSSPESILPRILHGRHAQEKGWHLLTEKHAARPEQVDIEALKRTFPTLLQDCPSHICKLALQLTNFRLDAARIMLCEGSMKSWWRQENEVVSTVKEIPIPKSSSDKEPTSRVEPQPVTPDPRCVDILRILDQVDGQDSTLEFKKTEVSTRDEGSDDEASQPQQAAQRRRRQDEPLLLYEPILSPNRGDIVNMFGDYYKEIHAQSGISRHEEQQKRPPLELGCKPRMPLIPRKRIRPQDTETTQKRLGVDPFGQIGGFQNPGGANGDLVHDEDFMAALELYQQINHTGVSLQDLRKVQAASREWNFAEHASVESSGSEEKQQKEFPTVEDDAQGSNVAILPSVGSAGTTGGNGGGGGGGGDTPGVGASLMAGRQSEAAGTSGDVELGNVPSGDTVSENASSVVAEGVKTGDSSTNTGESANAGENSVSTDDPPLRLDPEYEKYFKMLKMGLPIDAVKHAMKRDEKDPTIMDLDPEKSLKSQQKEVRAGNEKSDDGPALKDDPEYQKYFKMLKMGLPLDAVKHAMKRDEKDPAILDLDHDKSLKSQQQDKTGDEVIDDGPALKDDPEYQKYFKMLKMGLPLDAVKHAMKRDEKDPAILDLDHDKSLKSQQNQDDGPPLREDPEYVKYFKMLAMGLPAGAVKNALQRDGKDPSIIDLDPDKSLKSQSGGAVEEKDDGPPLCEDPQFTKYFKMLKMGLPIDAVRNALQRDGKDPTIMDLDHNKSLKSQTKNEVIDTGIALKDDPEYSKYFKMLKMGLPMDAVKHAMKRDDKDPTIMDLDPDKSVAFQLSQKSGRLVHRKKEKKRVRRKKIYWTPIDPGKVNEESIWSMVRGSVNMEELKYDTKEFENLFTESSNPADKKKAAARKEKSKEQKKSVQVIEGKRSMNGGIILARLKMEYPKIAEMVDVMDSGEFDSTQLSALKEFLPNDDERKALQAYMKKGEASPQAAAEALSHLSECEKYMVAMMKVDNAASKFDCMLFRVQFKGRIDEIIEGINIVNKACEEVRSSDRLRKMMAMILTLVNQINTGGDGNLAVGFSLDALLKLNEAKAFDKKTSVLQYLVKLVMQNDDSLMEFNNDIESVPAAGGVMLEALSGDVKVLADEVKHVHETAKAEADRLEKEGKLRKITLAELSEQVTVVRQIGGLSHYNQIDHITGRTQMERFASRATSIVDNTVDALEDLKNTYARVLSYFGEDERMASNDFFGTMKKFSLEFKSAAEEVEKQEKAKLKEKLRAAAKKAAAASRIAGIASPNKNKNRQPIGDIASMAANQAKLKRSGTNDKPPRRKTSSERSREETDSAGEEKPSRPPSFMAGSGVAEAAAAAARKREKSSSGQSKEETESTDEEKPSGPSSFMAGGGIAAAAAAAARKREKSSSKQRKETDSIDEEKPSGPPPFMAGGGIAAAAAAAARARSEKSSSEQSNETVSIDEEKRSGPPSFMAGGSIAAAAAAAARKREKSSCKQRKETDSTDKEKPSGPPPFMAHGGIAAAAAAAARARSEKSSSEQRKKMDSTDEEKPSGPSSFMAGGGIAAAAAAAARKREKSSSKQRKETDLIDEEKHSGPPPFMADGGIGAAAAAAARARSEKSSSEQSNETDSTDEEKPSGSSSFMAGGGIAAAAAAAARARSEKTSSEQNNETVSIDEEKRSGPPSFMAGGSIAAAAAAAARKREKSSSEQSNETDSTDKEKASGSPPFMAGGGIAAAAAAAARARSEKSSSEQRKKTDSTDEEKPSVPSSFMAGGGIAAAAAAAARKREKSSSKQRKETDLIDEEKPSGPPPFMAGGGIAAAAAAAARARSEKSSSEQSNETDSTDEEKPSGSSSFMAGGGIAAAAAAAARARSEKSSSEQSKEETDSIDEEKPSGPPSFMAGGGIAAAVAAAARKREKSSSQQRKETDSIDEEKPSGSPSFTAGGGIAAAAAARAKSKENANSEEQQSDVGARESIVDYAPASYEVSLSSVQDIPEMSSKSAEKSKPDTVWNAQGKLMVESDDEDVFFAAEEVEIQGSPTSNKDSNVKGAKTTEVMASSDPSTMSWIGRHLPGSFSSRSHEASDTTVESPVGLKKLPRSLPSSPIKSSPKSSKGLSKWMPHFGGHTETETPQVPSIEPSLSDTADVGSTSPGRSSSPLQRIMKRSQGNRNLTPKGSNGSGAGELEDA